MREVKAYKCDHCGEIFEDIEEIEKHERSLNNKDCLDDIVNDINDYFLNEFDLENNAINEDDLLTMFYRINNRFCEYDKRLEDFI